MSSIQEKYVIEITLRAQREDTVAHIEFDNNPFSLIDICGNWQQQVCVCVFFLCRSKSSE